MKYYHTMLGVFGAAALTLAGCSEVDYGDVQAARENVQEEERETAETRQEVAQNIAEEEAETNEARRETMKPVIAEEVREEQEETAEARRDGAAAIAEEERETEEARQELTETRNKLAAQQARDAFITDVETTLEKADQRIEQLEAAAADQKDPTKAETEKQISELQTRRDRVKVHLGELMGAETLKWDSHRDQVQRALGDLKGELDESE
jgi:hypothetical protein